MMWGYGGFGFLWMTLFWVGLILFGVWVVRRPAETGAGRSRALEILEERYARGDLDAEEFTTRRRALVE